MTPSQGPVARKPLSAPPPSDPPLSDTLRRLLSQSMNLMQGRFELFKLEIHDERLRLGQVLSRGLLAALSIFLSVQLVAMLLVALVWDTSWRIPVVVGLAVSFMVIALRAVKAYRAVAASTLFEASAQALAVDQQEINEAREAREARK